MYDRKVRPSGWWYAAAAALALGGILAGLAVAAKGVDDALAAVRSFDRTAVPGVVEVAIEDPGGYSIYQEFPGASDPGGAIQPPEVVVTDPAGQPVEAAPYDSFVSYDQGTLEGRGIYTFRADQPGTFRVTVAGAPDSTIAVGRGMGDVSAQAVTGLFGGVVGGIILLLAGIATGIVVAITVGVARGRSRRRLVTVQVPVTWPPTPIAPGWHSPTPAATPGSLVPGYQPTPATWPTAPGWPVADPRSPTTTPLPTATPTPAATLRPQVGQPTTPMPAPSASPRPSTAPGVTPVPVAPAAASSSTPPGVTPVPVGSAAASSSTPPGVTPVPVGSTAAFPSTPWGVTQVPVPSAAVSSSRPPGVTPVTVGSAAVSSSTPRGVTQVPVASAGVSSSTAAGVTPVPVPSTGPAVPAGPEAATVPVQPPTLVAGAGAATSHAGWGSPGAMRPVAPGSGASPPGAGTRAVASTGAAAETRPGAQEATLLGPAPTLVQAGTPDGSAPTEPLSRPGDPQSLRSPVDWSRSDLELPWDERG